VRTRRDPDDAVPNLTDLLPGADVLSNVHAVRTGVAVVDLHALERTGGDLQDRGVRTESADPGADDDAVAHCVQRGPAGRCVVDALVDRATRQIAARQRQRDAV